METEGMTHPTTEQRELLELAAKAAGITIKPMEVKNVTAPGDDRWIGYMTDPAEWPRGWFDPLTDDGDALRLAVKLRLDVMTCCYRDEIQVGGKVRATTFQPIDGKDRYEAVRLAIVRAAAAIAKGEK